MGSEAGTTAGSEAAGCAGDAARGAGIGCASGLASCSKGSISEAPMPHIMHEEQFTGIGNGTRCA